PAGLRLRVPGVDDDGVPLECHGPSLPPAGTPAQHDRGRCGQPVSAGRASPRVGCVRPRPDLPELLEAAHVVTLPMRVRFRGVGAREAVLLQGPSGWAEWAPFTEYGDADAARWLAAA